MKVTEEDVIPADEQAVDPVQTEAPVADAGQDPKPQTTRQAATPSPQDPPPDFDEKIARLIKSRADAKMKSLVDDRGKVLREAMDEQDAIREAINYLPRYLQSEMGPDQLRGFLSGGAVPNGWVPRVGKIPSVETQDLEWRAKYGREQSPAWAAARDYVIDPIGNIVPAGLQVATDLAVGALRHTGLAPEDASIDVKGALHGIAGTTREELDAIANTSGLGSQIVRGTGELVGTAAGFTVGLTGKALGAAGAAVGAGGKALFGAAGQSAGHAAGVFGTYGAVTAKPGEVLEGAAMGAASGAVMGMAQNVASTALRRMFRTPIAALGTDEKAVMKSLKDWASTNKVLPGRGESATAYDKRVVDTWISAGLPGAPAMPARKLMRYAIRGGADSLGFTLLDQQFREDFIDAAWNGDQSKWSSVIARFSGNFLGASALAVPLSSIVPWQRRKSYLGKPEAAKPVEAPQKQAEPLLLEAPKEEPSRLDVAKGEQEAAMEREYTARWDQLFKGDELRETTAQWEQVLGQSLDNVIPLGWTPSPKSVRPRPDAPTYFKDSAAREWLGQQADKIQTDATVPVGANTASLLVDWFPQNSQVAAQLREMATAGGDLMLPAKEARKFVDYYSRRADRKRDEIGQAGVQSLDSFVRKLIEAHGIESTPPKPKKVSGPDSEPTPPPIGDPVTGDSPTKAEGREGPSDRRIKIELPKSGHSFTLAGDTARPSPALRDALSLPGEMPARTLVDLVEKASLESALHSKSMLPGMEISVGIKATPGHGDKPGKMRRVVMGELQESALSPTPTWEKAVDPVPARGKDALEPEQLLAVAALRAASETSAKMEASDRSLLNSAIDVLDTVAAQNDTAVAETMAAMPQIVESIKAGEDGAVKALAESLTTKTPDRAMADMRRRTLMHGSTRKFNHLRAGSMLTDIPALAAGYTTRDIDAIPGKGERFVGAIHEVDWEPKNPAPYVRGGAHGAEDALLRYGRTLGLGNVPDGLQGLARAVHDRTGFDAIVSRNSAGEVNGMIPLVDVNVARHLDPLSELKAAKARGEDIPDNLLDAMRRAGESGYLDLQAASDAANKAIDAMEAGVATGGSLVKRAWDKFQRSQIQAVEDAGMPEVAEMGRNATTATKRFNARLSESGLMAMRRLPRKELDSMQDLVSDGNGGYADRYARAMDAATAKHFGEVQLSDVEASVVKHGRDVTLEAGKIAEELGIQQTDSEGKNPRAFTVDPNRRVLVREYSPEMQEARIKRSGPLFDAMVGWMEKTYGWTKQEAEGRFTEARSLTSLDATEIRRVIPVVPTHIDVPGKGIVRVLESRPLEHAERLAFRSSQVMGARSVMPRFTEKPVAGESFPQDPFLEPLPQAAQQMVDQVFREKGPDAADAAARLVRAMHGLPLERSSRIFTPGERGYHFVQVLDQLLGVRKAAALTMSFAMNVAEPISNAAHFGVPAVMGGYKEAAKALVTGRFAELHMQAVRDGFVTDTKLNDPWKGDDAVQTVENSLKKVGEILTTPLRMSQDLNEMVNYVAARDRLAAMKNGDGSASDASALSLLGFKKPEIDAMLKGNGTDAQYERYQRNIVGALSGGRSLVSAERSDVAHSKGFNTLVWFTGFFQARSRAMTQLAKDVAFAKGEDKAAAFLKMAQFGAMTAAAGLAGNLFKNYLTGGSDGMSDYLREQTSEGAVDTTQNILGLMASGVVGGLGQPVVEAFSALGEPGDSKDRVARAGLRLIGPLDAGLQFADFIRSMADVDVPGYENMDALGKTAKYLRNVMPAAKSVHEGLFGISALAISEKNVDLDNAQDSYYRWLRENRPQDFGSRVRSEEQRSFRDSMRSVMDLVAAGKDWTDDEVVDAVIDAEADRLASINEKQATAAEQGERKKMSRTQAYKEARSSVAASLRSRKMLPKPGEFSTEQTDKLSAFLGEKNLQTLRDHDEVVDLLAKRVMGANLRVRVQELQPE